MWLFVIIKIITSVVGFPSGGYQHTARLKAADTCSVVTDIFTEKGKGSGSISRNTYSFLQSYNLKRRHFDWPAWMQIVTR